MKGKKKAVDNTKKSSSSFKEIINDTTDSVEKQNYKFIMESP